MYVRENRKEEIRSWSFLSTVIRARARSSGGWTAGRLELLFGVGRGDGRTWRRWMSGERLARDYHRPKIVKKALQMGWLRPGDTHIAEALEKSRVVPRKAPFAPPRHPYGLGRRAAIGELVDDARRPHSATRWGKLGKRWEWVREWADTVKRTRNLILDGWSPAALLASLLYKPTQLSVRPRQKPA